LFAMSIVMPQTGSQNLFSLFVLKTISAWRTLIPLSATLLAVFFNSTNTAANASTAVFLNSYEKWSTLALNRALLYQIEHLKIAFSPSFSFPWQVEWSATLSMLYTVWCISWLRSFPF
jgi:hypothetical protein